MFDEPLYLVVAGVVAVLVIAIVLLLLRKKNAREQVHDSDDDDLTVHYDSVPSQSASPERVVTPNSNLQQQQQSIQPTPTSSQPPVVQPQMSQPSDGVASPQQEEPLEFNTDSQSQSEETQHTGSDLNLNWNTAPATAQVSVSQVEDLTEYQVYKQFGYFDKAAKSLSNYLIYQKEKPKELVSELCGLYLETNDLENLSITLDEYYQVFSKEEVEDIVKLGFELDPNSLPLRVFAEEKLGWSSEEVSKQIGDLSSSMAEPEPAVAINQHANTHVAKEENIQNQFQNHAVHTHVVNAQNYADREPLVLGFKKVSDITDEEQNAIVSFASEKRAVTLLAKEVEYPRAVVLFNRALKYVQRPANIAIKALDLDFKHRNIENYAHHLWSLYFVLGQYGRSIKEKMLGWGYNLGNHPIFAELDLAPSEYELREMGIKYGYISDSASNIKAKMLPLVEQDNSDTGHMSVQVGEGKAGIILQEAESQLDYGQLEEAMTTLENGLLNEEINEPQVYMMLFDLYERSESWERFEQFSREVRSKVSELPEEVIVALSRLMQEAK